MTAASEKKEATSGGLSIFSGNHRLHLWLGAALILILTSLVYMPAMGGDFLWDDNALLTDNAAIRAAIGLLAFWWPPAAESLLPHYLYRFGSSVDYFPLTSTSFWIEWRLWGMDAAGYHITNIFLHGLGAVLLWRVLQRLCIPGAFLAALVFAVHPVGVTSVAWIAERKNTLSIIFYLLSLLFYLRFDQTDNSQPPRHRCYWFALITFVLALCAKSSVVVLPVVLLLFVWWCRGKVTWLDVKRAAPFFLISVGFGLLTVYMQRRAMDLTTDSVLVRLIGGSWAIWFYLGKIFLPIHLTMVYPRWEIDPRSVISYMPALAFIGVLLLCWCFRKTWGRPCLFALLYFVVALGPVLGLFNAGYFSISRVSDHLQYLAMPGIIALLSAALVCTVRAMAPNLGKSTPFGVEILPATIILVICSILTWQHATVFASPEALWRDNAEKSPKAWRVRNTLGVALFKQARYQEAVESYKIGLQIEPNKPELHYNMATSLSHLGRINEAIQGFTFALAHGEDVLPRASKASAHSELGILYDKRGKLDESISHFQTALDLDPNNSTTHKNLGRVLARQGRLPEAIDQFNESLKVREDDTETHSELGNVLGRLGRIDEAIVHLERALQLDAKNVAAHNGLAAALERKGRLDEAVTHYRQAVTLKPDFARAHCNLGFVLAQKGQRDEAITSLKRALQLKSDYAEAQQMLRSLTNSVSAASTKP